MMHFTCKKRETPFSTQWIGFGIELKKKHKQKKNVTVRQTKHSSQ